MGQVYQCWWRACQDINVFLASNISCSIPIYDLFTESPAYNPTTGLYTVLASDSITNNPEKMTLLHEVCFCVSEVALSLDI
jgi:hypothetical protein